MSLITRQELEQAKANHQLLQATLEQIKRDFQLYNYNLELDCPENNCFEKVMEQIKRICEQLLETDPAGFFSLLYSIDLPESKVKSLLLQNENDPLQKISLLIAERELFKVLTKRHFSERSNK